MEFDPDIYVVMHSILSLKSGVTSHLDPHAPCAICPHTNPYPGTSLLAHDCRSSAGATYKMVLDRFGHDQHEILIRQLSY